MATESALVMPVSEAEPAVGALRLKYDPSAALGAPAHITINYPFLPKTADKSEAISALRQVFAEFDTFRFSLTRVKRFPGVLYLEPLPNRPIFDLIQAVLKRYPDSPQYGGKFGKVPPHLTVATVEDEKKLEEVAKELDTALEGKLPIHVMAREIWLIDNQSGRWTRRELFPLTEREGPPESDSMP